MPLHQLASIPALPPYQPLAKRKVTPGPSHEAGSLSKRPQWSTFNSNNVFDSLRTQDPTESEMPIAPTRDVDPRTSDKIVVRRKQQTLSFTDNLTGSFKDLATTRFQPVIVSTTEHPRNDSCPNPRG
jgi:hypothetical protein